MKRTSTEGEALSPERISKRISLEGRERLPPGLTLISTSRREDGPSNDSRREHGQSQAHREERTTEQLCLGPTKHHSRFSAVLIQESWIKGSSDGTSQAKF